MKEIVTKILSRDEVKKIDFTAAGIKVSPLGFNAVKSHVESERIKVKYSRKMPRNTAKYVYTHNRMLLSFRRLEGSQDREALIVHECVHAIADIAGKKLLVAHSEAAAYVAQCLYFYYRNQKDIDAGTLEVEFAHDILKEGWDIAARARKNNTLTEADLEPLLKAIGTDPLYRRRHEKYDEYDGV
ncbi:MAG: hypothetical protein AAFY56_22780 [Pseudomonadota bacterium]